MSRLVAGFATRRLRLRPVTLADAATIAREIGNYDVVRWLAGVPYPYSAEDARAFVSGAAPGRVWAIEDRDGLCGIVDARMELGYWLARRAWGRGYLTEAGDAAIDAYFADRRNRDIRSSHMDGNERSRHVLAKLGFVPQARISVRSAVLAQDVPAQVHVLTRARWKERRRYRLTTPRLCMREVRQNDGAAIRRIATRSGAFPATFVAEDAPFATAEWIESEKYRGRPGFTAAICARHGRLIGLIRIGRVGAGFVAPCAWLTDPAHCNGDLMAEAARAFLADMLSRFDLSGIDAHRRDMPQSDGGFLRRLGFSPIAGAADGLVGPLEPDRFVIYRLDRSNLKAHA